MGLNVAVQMDPIDRIDIDADSTFRIMEEGQARGHRLFYYTPDRLAFREGRVRRAAGRSRSAGCGATTSPWASRPRSTSPIRTWSGCARTRPST